MALDWWEFYEINHKEKNLREEIVNLKKETEDLRGEIETLKKGQVNKQARSIFCWFKK
ncbi:MAG: hypothetical protein WBC99_01940 [Candidatus Omnitrophota bacterium]